MIKVHNDTSNGYFIMMSIPYMDEIIIITIVMAIWVFSIMQFFRQWSEWLIPAPSCEPFYWTDNNKSDLSNSTHSQENLKLYQPWKFPSLVSLPLPPQRAGNFLRVPGQGQGLQSMRSPSLPLFGHMRHSRSSLTPQSAKRPSIVLTRASAEKTEGWGETASSMGSRLPSHLSLGSSTFVPTPAPTTPLSLFMDEKNWPANRSVTPVLFPEHHLDVPKIREQ